MTPAAALAAMRARGIVFVVDGDRLRYRAPAGVVTETTVAYLGKHKAALTALLRDEAERDPDALRLAAASAIFDAVPVLLGGRCTSPGRGRFGATAPATPRRKDEQWRS